MQFFTIVNHNTVSILERFGKYHKTLTPGLNFVLPFIDEIVQNVSLKEQSLELFNLQAVTKDNVTIHFDCAVFIKVLDAHQAVYAIQDRNRAVQLLAQTTLRAEIGKLKLDQLLQNREELNQSLQSSLSKSVREWGMTSKGVEILQIELPTHITKSMEDTTEAERQKRQRIILSEGAQQSEIIRATGLKTAVILQSEGEAQAVQISAEGDSKSLSVISEALSDNVRVVDFILLSQYVKSYKDILKNSQIVVVPKVEGKSSEYLNLAAMMLFGNQGRQQPYQNIQQITPTQTNIQKNTQQSNSDKQDEKQLLEDIIKKNVYYNDVRLYSDDEKKL
ncbi:hypothetical protein pb186bvf_012373 [Paramecium bursaria]